MNITRALELRRGSGDDLFVRVAYHANGGAAAGVKDLAAVGEVEVSARGVGNEVRVYAEGAVEEGGLLLCAAFLGLLWADRGCFRCHFVRDKLAICVRSRYLPLLSGVRWLKRLLWLAPRKFTYILTASMCRSLLGAASGFRRTCILRCENDGKVFQIR